MDPVAFLVIKNVALSKPLFLYFSIIIAVISIWIQRVYPFDFSDVEVYAGVQDSWSA